MDQVRLIGSIPEAPHSSEVEGLLRRTVAAHGGRWEIRIRHLPETPWHLLRIKRSSDGFTATVIVDLYEEPLQLVATNLSEALKDADGPSAREATAH
jgi:hypothetical protein